MTTTAETGLGSRLRYYRKLRALTQEELAITAGVKPSHITNIERGKKGISVDVLLLLCKRLNIHLTDLLPEEDLRDDFELREQMIGEVVAALRELESPQIGFFRAMVCSFSD
ncbi:MAG: helix-turn-helix domain-containing protein [Oscillospiraceae bacterium]|nr:helix-turn-helix domain-containing protein [Oscillospiraceae bacterium]